jgi:hypothetical protein
MVSLMGIADGAPLFPSSWARTEAALLRFLCVAASSLRVVTGWSADERARADLILVVVVGADLTVSDVLILLLVATVLFFVLSFFFFVFVFLLGDDISMVASA